MQLIVAIEIVDCLQGTPCI